MTSTKKSLLASGLSILICVALLLGTTFAWFTDSVTNSGNEIQAGTLKIGLDTGDAETLFTSDENFLWEPGRSQKATATVSNEGSLWLKYTMSFENVKTTGDADITNVLDVYLVDSNADSLDNAQRLGTVAELMTVGSFGAKDAVLAPKGYTGTDGDVYKRQAVDRTDADAKVAEFENVRPAAEGEHGVKTMSDIEGDTYTVNLDAGTSGGRCV